MAENITWLDRTDATTPTGSTSEADKTIYNTVKAFINSPSQSLGTFTGTLITLDGTGSNDDFTL